MITFTATPVAVQTWGVRDGMQLSSRRSAGAGVVLRVVVLKQMCNFFAAFPIVYSPQVWLLALL